MLRNDPLLRRLEALRDAVLRLGQGRLKAGVLRPGRSWTSAYQASPADSHHGRLALRLDRDFSDPVLAEAGYLHGVPARWLNGLDVAPAEGVDAVLRDWERLRRPRSEAEHTLGPKELIAEVLPGLPEPRAAFLLVAERLDRWDPDRALHRWARAFRTTPVEPELGRPGELPGGGDRKGRRSGGRPGLRWAERQEVDRLRDVAAPTAEFCGLWEERNTLENLALGHSDRRAFRKAIGWAITCGADGTCGRLAGAIEAALAGSGDQGRGVAAWEWRHAASIHKNVDLDRPGKEKVGRLWRCGFVTVECPDVPSCYRLLGHLHASRSLRYHADGLLDQVGRPTRAGYRALRTVVTAELGGRQLAIAVRFVPRDSREPASLPAPRELLEARVRAIAHRRDGIRVYTPAGAFKTLPAGATVLNFAAAVHSAFVGMVDHAVLNESERVGVLHRLEDGDRVELVKADSPRMPPAGWEDEVPPRTRKGLHKLLRTSFGPVLKAEGMRRIRKAIAARGVAEVGDDALLANLVGIAAEIAEDNMGLKSRRSADWWTEGMGLQAFVERGERIPWSGGLDDRKAQALQDALAGVVERLRYRDDEIDLPDAMKGSARRIHKCPECRPAPGSTLVVTSEHGRVVVHDAEADCAEGGERLAITGTPTLQQFFVIETTNRAGVALDVLSIFQQARIDVVDIAGRRLGPRWAVVRLEAELVGPAEVRALLFELRKVDGVQRVRGPSQPPLEILEGRLPPRRERPPEPWALPQPYVCGDFVRQDSSFYGRRFELMELEQALTLFSTAGSESGGAIFVTGPLKTGKTSLVKRFLRDLERRRQASLAVFCKAQVGDAWADVERRLVGLLADEAQRYDVREGGTLSRKLPDALGPMLAEIRGSLAAPPVVLVIDEALRPMREAHRAAKRGERSELEEILRFRDMIERSPGTLVVWVGPEAPVRHLHHELGRMLRSVDRVRLQPFDQDDTRALLAAEKMSWRYPIEFKKGLAKAATTLTGGNPFWIANLGYLMYRRESRKPVRPIRYNHQALSEAAEELVHHGGPFEDRLFPDGDTAQGPAWVWQLVHVLSEDPASGAPDDPGWSVDELGAALEERGVELEPGPLRVAVEDLVALGGLIRVVGKGSDERVRVAAPLLARFVRDEVGRGRRRPTAGGQEAR
jgi:hypothetical protein